MKKELQKKIEIGIFSSLDKKDIYKIYDFYIDDFCRFIKMDLTEQKSFRKIISADLVRAISLYKGKKNFLTSTLFLPYLTYFFNESLKSFSNAKTEIDVSGKSQNH